MARNLETRRVLQEVFTRHLPSYYETAPEDADVPFLVFDLREVTTEQGVTQAALGISVFASSDEEEDLERLLDTLERELDYRIFTTAKLHLRTYRAGSRQDIDTNEPRLIHKRLGFELRQIERRCRT